MKVFIHTPYSLEKNLGRAYNEFMELLPDDASACFIDGDVSFTVPNYGHILNDYATRYPNNVLTCWTNRIHKLSVGQQSECDSSDYSEVLQYAQKLLQFGTVTPIQGPVSGFLLIVPKSVWIKNKFVETNHYRPGEPNLLGVDNYFTNQVRNSGIEILRMNGLIVYHSYRLLSNGKDKTHLL